MYSLSLFLAWRESRISINLNISVCAYDCQSDGGRAPAASSAPDHGGACRLLGLTPNHDFSLLPVLPFTNHFEIGPEGRLRGSSAGPVASAWCSSRVLPSLLKNLHLEGGRSIASEVVAYRIPGSIALLFNRSWYCLPIARRQGSELWMAPVASGDVL